MEIPINITLTISKKVLLEVPESGVSNCNKLVEEQILLPNELSKTVRNIFNLDLDLKRAKIPYCLKTALDSCDNWNVLDIKYNI